MCPWVCDIIQLIVFYYLILKILLTDWLLQGDRLQEAGWQSNSISRAKLHLTITAAPCWAPPVCFLCILYYSIHFTLFQSQKRRQTNEGEENAVVTLWHRVSLPARCGSHKGGSQTGQISGVFTFFSERKHPRMCNLNVASLLCKYKNMSYNLLSTQVLLYTG